jgi:hypothetical protein
LRGQGSATRGEAGANKRVGQQEATRQPDGTSKGGGASRGCSVVRSHATTNRANGRRGCIERCQHIKRERGGRTIGNTTTSRGKQEASLHKNKSSTCGTSAAVEATATRHWWRFWQTTGGGGGVGGGVGNGVSRTVAKMG